MHVEVLAEQVLAERRSLTWIIDACENADSTLCVDCGVVGAGLERGGAEIGMEAREAVPGLVDDHLDAALVRRVDDRRQVVAQAVVVHEVRISACASGWFLMAFNNTFFGTGP